MDKGGQVCYLITSLSFLDKLFLEYCYFFFNCFFCFFTQSTRNQNYSHFEERRDLSHTDGEDLSDLHVSLNANRLTLVGPGTVFTLAHICLMWDTQGFYPNESHDTENQLLATEWFLGISFGGQHTEQTFWNQEFFPTLVLTFIKHYYSTRHCR